MTVVLPINVINLTDLEKGNLIVELIKKRDFANFYEALIEIKKIGSLIQEMKHFDGEEKDIYQNQKYHKFNYPYHTHAVLKKAELHYPGDLIMNLGGVLHDIGKGLNRGENKDGQPNDLNHEELGEKPAETFMKRIGIPQDIIDDVLFIVRLHGLAIAQADLSLTPKEAVDKFKDKSVRNAIKKIIPYVKSNTKEELKEKLTLLFNFKKLDALGFQDDEEIGNFSKHQLDIVEYAYPRYMEFIDKEDFFATN